jgi:hypothetical protein
MNALVLGARGAVGRVVVDELRRRGHHATPAGRAGTEVLVDLASPEDWSTLATAARSYDVVVNASGIEDARLADVAPTPLVDVSASAAHLDQLADRTPASGAVVLGAGLAPGLSTVLLASLGAEPGADLDLGVLLGTGERHGAAAVAWTQGLVGTDLHDPPEPYAVRNLLERRALAGPSGRRRTYLRADFPDHALLGPRDGVVVRSHLAVGGPATTAALALVARVPSLRGMLARTPHVGSDAWHLVARDRHTGRRAWATGRNQSLATGVLTALAAERVVEAGPGRWTTADLTTPDEAHARLLEVDPTAAVGAGLR